MDTKVSCIISTNLENFSEEKQQSTTGHKIIFLLRKNVIYRV